MNSGCRLTFVPAERAERLIRVFASRVHGVSFSRRAEEKKRAFASRDFLIYFVLSLLFLKEKFSHLRFGKRGN